MGKRKAVERQRELTRSAPGQNYDWKDRPTYLRLRLIPRRGAKCDGCGEVVKKLRPLWDDVEPFSSAASHARKFYCLDCSSTVLVKQLEASKKQDESRKKLLGGLRRAAGGGSKNARPSLTPEGNVPLMVRLIQEGKTRKEIRREFRKLYHALGRTDEKFIRSRVRLYRGRALKKIEAMNKKGAKK